MTVYPNRGHKNADDAARRQALASLADLAGEAALLHRSVKGGRDVDGDNTQVLTDLVRKLTRDLSVLGTLREVREATEADQEESVTGLLARPALLQAMADALGLRTDLSLPPAGRPADLARRVLAKSATAPGGDPDGG